MKNKELMERLAAEIHDATPNQLDDILLKCKEQKGKAINMNELAVNKKPNRKKWTIGIAAAAAAFVMAVGIGVASHSYYAVDSVIDLDVNPSIELKTNKNDTVLSVEALNDDANEILDGMDLKGVDFDVAVNALVGSMLKNGYIDELKNSILVSVDNDDENKSRELESRLMESINAILSENEITPAILAQTVTSDEELQKLADEYHISIGRVSLIQRILAKDPTKSFADLAKLSVNDLYLLADSKDIDFDDLLKQGDPSKEGYIEASAAKSAAFSHAGIQAAQASNVKAELDFDDGVMVYEVEFISNRTEYDYDIDATTGAVLKADKEAMDQDDANDQDDDDDQDDDKPVTSATSLISKDKAKSAAFSHAGVSSAKNVSVILDKEDGKYDVEFIAGGYEYDYEINARTGKIIEYDRDKLEGEKKSTSSKAASSDDDDDDRDDDDDQDDDDD